MKNQVEENTKDSSRSLLIKNLDRSITAKDFFRMFEEFGDVKSSKLEVDESGVSKNYGYVLYSDVRSAEAAKQALVKFYK
jgi:RNA recognition motif-containing protein